jgi:hypothetical protein
MVKNRPLPLPDVKLIVAEELVIDEADVMEPQLVGAAASVLNP